MAVTGPLMTRHRILKALIDTDRGTAVTPTVVGLAFDAKYESTAEFIPRKPGSASGGHILGMHGAQTGKMSFTLELRGTGAATAGASKPSGRALQKATSSTLKT